MVAIRINRQIILKKRTSHNEQFGVMVAVTVQRTIKQINER